MHRADPSLESEFEQYTGVVRTRAACLKRSGDYNFCDWEVDGSSTGGDPDLFKFFVERAHKILRIGGRLGFLVPSAIYNNEGCTGLRHLMLDESEVRAFYGFENRKKIFNIHSSYKFVCLVLEKKSQVPDKDVEFRAAFMRHDVAELEQGPPKGVQVLIKRSELEKLSPGTLAFLEYRSERDREIVLKMYGLLPDMQPLPLLGDQGPGTWNAKFYREFDMTNDRDLWTKPNGKLWTPKEVCGLDWPADPSIPFADVRTAMCTKGFWPLYEGKHIEQFLVDTKPIERWVSIAAAEKKNGRSPDPGSKLVFRDIARNTDERTCIAAVLPEKSCSGNTLATLKSSALPENMIAAILNSFAIDFLMRLKIAGTHLNWTYVSRVAVPPASDIKPASTYSSLELNGSQAIADCAQLFSTIWLSNKSVARAYGLSPDDFAHILSTFPVFARKRPAFYAYLMDKVREWKCGK